jgi:TRAP-type C4-dicarboxylate transport system permease large subunit
LVIYGMMADASIAALYLGGLIPGAVTKLCRSLWR